MLFIKIITWYKTVLAEVHSDTNKGFGILGIYLKITYTIQITEEKFALALFEIILKNMP